MEKRDLGTEPVGFYNIGVARLINHSRTTSIKVEKRFLYLNEKERELNIRTKNLHKTKDRE